MPRQSRSCPGGYVYHVWNRAAGRLKLFQKPADFEAFERVMIEAHQRVPIRVMDWCLMDNHWHFVVFPAATKAGDNEVTAFFRWLTQTHSMRVHVARRMTGLGPLYQGRFKALPVQRDEHLLTLLRYVERNPLRAKRVKRATDWRFGSEFLRQPKAGTKNGKRRNGKKSDAKDEHVKALRAMLSDWPVERPRRWASWVNEPQTDDELAAVRLAVRRSRPFGSDAWTRQTADKLDLGWTLRSPGRPKKEQP